MTPSFPFMTTYDPPGASEGTLDPLGLYQIADQLAVQLVPAVLERIATNPVPHGNGDWCTGHGGLERRS
jgi:hypothetical protein